MNTKNFLFTIITFLSANTLLPAWASTKLSSTNTHNFSAQEKQQIDAATQQGAIAGAKDGVSRVIPGILFGIPLVLIINEIASKKINRLELTQWLFMMSTGIISLCAAGGARQGAVHANNIATNTILKRHGKRINAKEDKIFL